MEKRVLLAALVVAVMLVPAFALAQANFDLRYDPQTATTLTGTVIATINYNPANPSMGPQAVVITSGGVPYTVFLGPGWFNNQIGLSLRPGDTITVTASRRSVAGQNYLVASTLIFGSQTFMIRSTTGMPMWSGVMVPTPPMTAAPPCVPAPPMQVMPGQVPTAPVGSGPAYEQPSTAQVPKPPMVPVPATEQSSTIEVPTPPTMSVPATQQPATAPTGTEPTCGQPSAAPVGAGPATPMTIAFNSDNMVRVNGRIVSTETVMTAESDVPYVVAHVKPYTATSHDKSVLLGPAGVFDSTGISLDYDTPLSVIGSAVDINGQSYIVATSVSQGTNFLTLRSQTGVPLFGTSQSGSSFLLAPPDSNF